MFGVGNKKLNNSTKKKKEKEKERGLKILLSLLTKHILLSVDMEVGLWNYDSQPLVWREWRTIPQEVQLSVILGPQ
jgi:hypothetical protein